MPAERRGQAIAFEIGSTGDGRNPMFNGRRQPSCGGTSRMMREYQVRICERLGVKFPGSTRPHAPYMKVPAHTLVPLPDELSFAAGAAISCGTGTAYQALRRMNVSGRDTIAVIGQGPVGLSATQLAAHMGARVIAIDVSPQRLARAKEFDAAALINPALDDAVAGIKALTNGMGADMTLDTSGAAEGRLIAVRATKAWGTACFVGEGGNVTLDVSPDLLRKQLTIVGSWTFSTV